MFKYTKKQVQDGVPIWDIYYDENRIGCLTDFPLDGPHATVRVAVPDGENTAIIERTVDAATVNSCFDRAISAHDALIEDMVNRLVPC